MTVKIGISLPDATHLRALGGWCQTRFLDENGSYEE